MNRKLIFFDIDGTIIPEDTGVIPESTKEAIKKAKENGHLVFINTGRTFSGITQPIFDLEFNGYVCGCGTHIYFDGKKIYSSVIPKEKCIETVALLRKNKVNAFYEGDKGIYFDYSYSNPFMERAKKMLRTNGKSVEVILEDKDEVFDKCLIKFTDEDIDKKDIIMPFKKGAVVMAFKTGSPIVPFAINGQYKKGKLKIIIGKPYKPKTEDAEKEIEILEDKVIDLIKKIGDK